MARCSLRAELHTSSRATGAPGEAVVPPQPPCSRRLNCSSSVSTAVPIRMARHDIHGRESFCMVPRASPPFVLDDVDHLSLLARGMRQPVALFRDVLRAGAEAGNSRRRCAASIGSALPAWRAAVAEKVGAMRTAQEYLRAGRL